MIQLTRLSAFAPMLSRMGASALCFGLGAGSWQLFSSSWVFGAGLLAFQISEIGSTLASDYYFYRDGARGTLSEKMSPPQLVLKGAWGTYLLAFFFVLVVALSLEDRGWVLIPLAFAGFFGGYYRDARPFKLCGRKWGCWLTEVVSTLLPFVAGSYMARRSPMALQVIAAGGLYILMCIYSSWHLRSQIATSSR